MCVCGCMCVCKMSENSRRSSIREIENVFTEYSRTSTIHGVRYLCDKRRHWSERIWWIISVSTSICMCAGFLFGTWIKWNDVPLIITFADEATPISSIPFPTITICNDFMVNTSALNYSRIQKQLSKNDFGNVDLDVETIQKVLSLSHFCAPPLYLGDYITRKNITRHRNILQHLQELEARLFHSGDKCLLTGDRDIKCDTLFTQLLTDAGLCYTFNQMGSTEIYNVDLLADDFQKVGAFYVSHRDIIDNGNMSETNLSYPYKMANAGTGLEINMWIPETENHFDPMCDGLLEGLKVQIHSALDVPRLDKFFYHIPFDHDVRITVRPHLMITKSSVIETHSLEQRKCIADNEHNLKFFKTYTQRNCHLDILAIESFRVCGCVLFWMPRLNETKMCSYSHQFKCVKSIENSNHTIHLMGKCLPPCNWISYEADISTSKRASNPLEPVGQKRIKMLLLFKDQQYYASSRSELYGKMDFINFTATCGGILNLFLGISILSVIEIIYFATFRLACNLYKHNLKNKDVSGDEQEQEQEQELEDS